MPRRSVSRREKRYRRLRPGVIESAQSLAARAAGAVSSAASGAQRPRNAGTRTARLHSMDLALGGAPVRSAQSRPGAKPAADGGEPEPEPARDQRGLRAEFLDARHVLVVVEPREDRE